MPNNACTMCKTYLKKDFIQIDITTEKMKCKI